MKRTVLRAALLGGAAAAVLSCSDSSPLGPNRRSPTAQGLLVPIAPIDSLVQTTARTAGVLLQCSPLPAASVTQTIGPAGGTLQVGPHTLSIPAGALDTMVTITATAPSDTVNRVLFEPEGLAFQQTAALTMSYANCGPVSDAKWVLYTNDAGTITEHVPSVDASASQQVTAQLQHFSDYAIAW